MLTHKWFKGIRAATCLVLIFATLLAQSLVRLPAVEAAGATGLSLTVTSDDTSALVNDLSTTNGIVPDSGGQITYQWGWSDPGGSSASFTQVLPAGMIWADESVANGCVRTGTLASGQTLTCTITGLSGIGSTNKVATVYNLANGTSLSSFLQSGPQTSTPVVLTVAAKPSVAVEMLPSGPGYLDAVDPEAPGTEPGLKIPITFALYVPRTSTDGAKGAEPLQDPISFTATIPSGSKLFGCSNDYDVRREPYPRPVPGAQTAANTVPNTGTIDCVQSSSTSVTVTLTGTDTSFVRFPTQTYIGNPISASGHGYFAVAGFYIWKPLTDFTVGVAANIPTSISGLTVTGLSGQQGVAPTANTTAVVLRRPPGLSLDSDTSVANIMIGSNIVNNGTVYPGAIFTSVSRESVPPGSGSSETGSTTCKVWDPALATIRNILNPVSPSSAGNISPLPTTSDLIVEYGTNVYTTEADRKAADCGAVGDGNAAWYASVADAAAAPGGLAAVSQVRFKYTRDLNPSESLDLTVAFVASSDMSLPSKTKIPVYTHVWSDQTSIIRSTWLSQGGTVSSATGPAGSGLGGSQVTLSNAQVRATTNIVNTDIKPGTSTNVTIQPTISNPVVADGRNALNTTITTTLPDGCFTFVSGATTPASVTPITPAAPGAGQTCRNVAGQVIVWNLGDVPTTPAVNEAAITFTVNADPSTPAPYVAAITSLIASDSDLAANSARSSTDTVVLSSVNEFFIAKTATSSFASPGLPITYRLGWNNGLASPIGQAWIVDVLPYNGDARGTNGLGILRVDSVATVPSGLAVEYTTDASATVAANTLADPTGETGTSWTSVKPPSGITAIRARTQSLVNGDSGYVDITVTPSTIAPGGSMANNIYGKADGIGATALGVSQVTLPSSSSTISGHAYKDTDYSGGKNASDPVLASATVTLSGYNFGPNGLNNSGGGDDMAVSNVTTTTDSLGSYQFIVAPGNYLVSAGKSGYTTVAAPSSSSLVAASTTLIAPDILLQENLATPALSDDTDRVIQGGNLILSVLSNDNDLGAPADQGAASVITSVGSPQYGIASLRLPYDGTIIYIASSIWPAPISGDSYTDSFTYTVTNPQGTTATATTSVTVIRLASVTSIGDTPTIAKPATESVSNPTPSTISDDKSTPASPAPDEQAVSTPEDTPGEEATPRPSSSPENGTDISAPATAEDAAKDPDTSKGSPYYWWLAGLVALAALLWWIILFKRRKKDQG